MTRENKIYTLDEFNELYKQKEKERLKSIKFDEKKIKLFKLKKKLPNKVKIETISINGVPQIKRTVIREGNYTFDMDCFNRLIVEWFKMFTDCLDAKITNTTGLNFGKYWKKNNDKGRADITVIFKDFELGIETKRKYEKQLDSQKKFQSLSLETNFRKYVIIIGEDDDSFVEFQKVIINKFHSSIRFFD
jgi:ribosomal protein S4E